MQRPNRQSIDPRPRAFCAAQGRPLSPNHFPNDPGLWDETLDLTPYINTSAFSVRHQLIAFGQPNVAMRLCSRDEASVR